MSDRTIRGKVAAVGIGESTYYKHGQSPDAEFVLALQAIMRAAEDADRHAQCSARLCGASAARRGEGPIGAIG